MKKTVLIVLLFAFCCMDGMAQRSFSQPLKSSREFQSGLSDYSLSLKLGCPWSVMPVSNLDNTRFTGLFGYLIGIAGERNFEHFSIGLEGTFAQKGTRMRNTKTFQNSLQDTPPSGTSVLRYTLAYNVFTVRIPLTWHFSGLPFNENIVPYVFAGPEFDIPSPKNYTLAKGFNHPDPYCIIEKKINDGDWFQIDKPATTLKGIINASVVGGFGAMITIPTRKSSLFLKVDLAANYGLINLSASKEESIHAHSAELSFRLLYPIKKRLHDASWSFKKRRKLFR